MSAVTDEIPPVALYFAAIAMSPVGHFAVGLAAKPLAPKVPLWLLLTATLVLDLLFGLFALVGLEGINKEIYWSHGLFMSLVWSVLAGLLAARLFHGTRSGVVVGLAVFSHWVLDFISHPMGFGHPQPPDLPLFFHGSPRVGLGLYNNISVHQALEIEAVMFILGAALYTAWKIRERKHHAPQPA